MNNNNVEGLPWWEIPMQDHVFLVFPEVSLSRIPVPKPMIFSFYPDRPSMAASYMKTKIRAGMGVILPFDERNLTPNTITIFDETFSKDKTLERPKDAFSSKFIEELLLHQSNPQSVDLNDFLSTDSAYEKYDANDILLHRKRWDDLSPRQSSSKDQKTPKKTPRKNNQNKSTTETIKDSDDESIVLNAQRQPTPISKSNPTVARPNPDSMVDLYSNSDSDDESDAETRKFGKDSSSEDEDECIIKRKNPTPKSSPQKKAKLTFFSQAVAPPRDGQGRIIRNGRKKDKPAATSTAGVWIEPGAEDPEEPVRKVPPPTVNIAPSTSRALRPRSRSKTKELTPQKPKSAVDENASKRQERQNNTSKASTSTITLEEPDTTAYTLKNGRRVGTVKPTLSQSPPQKNANVSPGRRAQRISSSSSVSLDDDDDDFRPRTNTSRPARGGSRTNSTIGRKKRFAYSWKERQGLLDIILENNWGKYILGTVIYKNIEEKGLFTKYQRPGASRTWQSLKEHFVKQIIPDLDLPPNRRKLKLKISDKDLDRLNKGRVEAARQPYTNIAII